MRMMVCKLEETLDEIWQTVSPERPCVDFKTSKFLESKNWELYDRFFMNLDLKLSQ